MIKEFDPKNHKGCELLELKTKEMNRIIITLLVPAKVSFEEAAKTPWYYVVREE